MGNILIISFSDLERDPRVRRQIMFLKDSYRVTACGLTDPKVNGVSFIPVHYKGLRLLRRTISAILLKMKQFERVYWLHPLVRDAAAVLQSLSFDLVLANNIYALPVAVNLAEGWSARIIFDAHEYSPGEQDDRWVFRFFLRSYFHYLCSRYLSKVDAMVTVSKGIAEEYSRVYGVACGVLTNAPFYEDQEPSSVNEQHIRLVHHGLAHPSRRLENMIYLIDHLDERFTLDFMLMVNDRSYFDRLQRLAEYRPRVCFCSPVPMPEISRSLNQYDIGVYLLPASAFNTRLALPNKLFEFIQGRLCVAIWPSPEMARVVREYNCGVVAQDFTLSAIAKELNSLTAKKIWNYKQHTQKAAERLSAESNRHILLHLVKNLVE